MKPSRTVSTRGSTRERNNGSVQTSNTAQRREAPTRSSKRRATARSLPLSRNKTKETEPPKKIRKTSETKQQNEGGGKEKEEKVKPDEVSSNMKQKQTVTNSDTSTTKPSQDQILRANFDGKQVVVKIVIDGTLFYSENLKSSSSSPGIGTDGNQFFCEICKGFGDVVCCDGCPKVYHANCLSPGDNIKQDPWYCPRCRGILPPPLAAVPSSAPSENNPKRAVKHKCSECKQSGDGSIPMLPCGGCGVLLHHPSCKKDDLSTEDGTSVPMCSNCRVEAAFDEEEMENEAASDDDTDEEPLKSLKKKKRPNVELKSKKKRKSQPFNSDFRDSNKKKKKKKKKKYRDGHGGVGDESTSKSQSEISSFDDYSARYNTQTVPVIPGFFFFLMDNRHKIERVLSRKHRYFNRLPKGLERNELISREGALWWVKLRPMERKRYLKLSMQDFEERVVEWKEEKTIREMTGETDVQDQATIGEDLDSNSKTMMPEDELLRFQKHNRLYLGTSVGSKPFQPEAGKSNNRILLELLQDTRFHSLPLFSANRLSNVDSESPETAAAIPHFDIHGPISTSVGDECLGCKRGWNHYCPVMKRRLPAIEYRSRLQPPMSSLMASKIGLGLRPSVAVDVTLSQHPELEGAKQPLFKIRETEEAKEAKLVPVIPSLVLHEPATRMDDVALFVEEAIAMKLPEPPRPSLAKPDAKKKSILSRGALPTKARRKISEAMDGLVSTEPQEINMNKCGRCRAVIFDTDTGCFQCRRAQLVINTAKKGTPGDTAGSKTLRVQTTMLGRLTKETNFKEQDDQDRDLAKAILGLKWAPSAVQTAEQIRAPAKKELSSQTDSSVHEDDIDDYEEIAAEMETLEESKPELPDEAEVEINSAKGKTLHNEENSDGGPAHISIITNKDTAAEKTDTVDRKAEEQVQGKAMGEPRAQNEVNGNTRQTRRQRSARLAAAAQAAAAPVPSTTPNKVEEESVISRPDRQKLALEHREEANELQRRCLMLACCGILQAMIRRDPLCLFAEPVPANVVGYSLVVKNPIDFSKIRSRVQRGRYTSLGAFVADARLLCTNALAFNPSGSVYSKTAKELHDILDTMHDRARKWMTVIKETHSAAFARRVDDLGRNCQGSSEAESGIPVVVSDDFDELRRSWPEAVDILESGDWLKDQIASDFMRTRENEVAFYGAIAIRRTAAAAGASLAPYTDSMSTYGISVRRTQVEDESLREAIDSKVARISAPMQLKDVPTWREEAIVKTIRRVQSRRVESRITSESGCARCDGVQLTEDTKLSLQKEAMQHSIAKKTAENDPIFRVDESRLFLTTGLASANARKLIGREIDGSVVSNTDAKGQAIEKVDATEESSEVEKADSNGTETNDVELKLEGLEESNKLHQTQEEGGKGGMADAPVAAEEPSKMAESVELRAALKVTDKWDKVNDVKVNVKGSKIHGWGLYADQPFKKGDVVAEYVGEYVSNAVADKREKMYQERRIQDYQFRVGENLVIDATLKGGHGRYINHNCNPNCYAQIVDGKPPNQHLKRVMIIAQRDIKAREEVTYDYQFPLELDLDARIPCNCGSLLCRGFMNWDLPEKGSKNRVLGGQKRGGNIRDRIRRLGKPLKR